VNAARLRQEADATAQEAQSLRADVAGRTRRADEVDPDVQPDGSRRSAGTRNGDVSGPGHDGTRAEAHLDRGRAVDGETRRGGVLGDGTPADNDGRNGVSGNTVRPEAGPEAAREETARRDRENPRDGI
jgi:hypothetical protein